MKLILLCFLLLCRTLPSLASESDDAIHSSADSRVLRKKILPHLSHRIPAIDQGSLLEVGTYLGFVAYLDDNGFTDPEVKIGKRMSLSDLSYFA